MQTDKLVIGMVGLPARGKTYVSKKLSKYLNWMRIKTNVFNIGNYRRLLCGASELKPEFFDPENKEGVRQRNQCAFYALKDLCQYLREQGQIAIYDGTNTTKERRKFVKEMLHEELKGISYQLIWLEIICDDQQIIQKNIVNSKLSNPDFVGKNQEVAINEFKERIQNYEKIYETLDQNQYQNISMIQYKNLGQYITAVNIQGQLQRKILSFILNMNIKTTPIYLIQTFNKKKTDFNKDKLIYNELIKNYLKKEIISDHSFISINNFCQSMQDDQQIETNNRLLREKLIQNIQIKQEYNLDQDDNKLQKDNQKHFFLKFIDCFCESQSENEEMINMLQEMNFNIVKEENLNDCLSFEEFERMKKINNFQDPKRQQLNMKKLLEQQIDRIEPFIYEIERQNFPILIFANSNTLQQIFNYLVYEQSTVHSTKKVKSINDIQENVLYKLIPDVYHCKIQKIKIDIYHKNIYYWTSGIISQSTDQEIENK